MKKKRILLVAIVALGVIYAAMLAWTIKGIITGSSPDPVSSLLLIVGQIFFYVYICTVFYKYWNTKKDSK